MRHTLALLAALTLAPLAPAAAQSLFDTHTDHAGLSGKVPTKTYRPIVQDQCRAARNFHQTGKIPLAPQVAANMRGCPTEVAVRDTGDRKD